MSGFGAVEEKAEGGFTPYDRGTPPTYWYRLETDVDYIGSPVVRVRSYTVMRTTPKGVWLWASSGQRFVRLASHKRWACPTVEEAVTSFIARKRRQIKIVRAQLARAEQALVLAERGKLDLLGGELVLAPLAPL